MQRITQKDNEAVCERINRITGSPLKTWERKGEKNVSAIGNYHLDGAYGGWALHRIVSDGGGVDDVFRCGHVSKRELYDRMQAFISGLNTNKTA